MRVIRSATTCGFARLYALLSNWPRQRATRAAFGDSGSRTTIAHHVTESLLAHM
ncbi:MAG TPA: hypothetical protein VKB47_17335 [Terracidiphilus sp.]|nr:hypothetical protein [Terracidiphilus sp.]